jgi:hypothetical protein
MLMLTIAWPLRGQEPMHRQSESAVPATVRVRPNVEAAPARPYRSLTDSLSWARARNAAITATGRRLVVSLEDRRLWWMNGSDTLFAAPVAVGKGTRLEYENAAWEFSTPRGQRRVIRKEQNPVWIPPDWHYVELARDSAYTLVRLERTGRVPLADGSEVVVRGDRVGRLLPNGSWETIPTDQELLFGDTLIAPPIGTANRRIVGELGAYKLDLGEGYLIHGTPDQNSIGSAVTHGCIRVGDEDLEYLFRAVPVGTPVYIY